MFRPMLTLRFQKSLSVQPPLPLPFLACLDRSTFPLCQALLPTRLVPTASPFGMETRAISRTLASPLATALTRSASPLAPSWRIEKQRQNFLGGATASHSRHFTRAVARCHSLSASAGAGAGAGAREGAGLGAGTDHSTPFSLTRTCPRPQASLASSLFQAPPPPAAARDAPWPVPPRQHHPTTAGAGLQSAFILAEGEGRGRGRGRGRGLGWGRAERRRGHETPG